MNRLVYRLLPGRGRSLNFVSWARCRLWLAPDHLLSVSNQGYTEDYKRFQLNDIQSITLRKTRRGRVTNFVLGGLVLGFALPALYGWISGWDVAGVCVLAVHSALFIIGLLINTARGPTCICTLRTAVQIERLHALSRVRPALRAIRLIREAAESVQSALASEAIDTGSAVGQGVGGATAVRPREAGPHAARRIKPYRGMSHAVLFTVLLLDACHSAVQFSWQSVVMYFLSLCLMLGLLASLMLALIRQVDSDLDAALKRITWWTMGYVMASYVLNTAVFYVFAGLTRDPARTSPDAAWGIMRSMWTTSPLDSPAVLVTVVFSLVGSAAFGTIGWVQWLAFRRRRGQLPPQASSPPLPPSA